MCRKVLTIFSVLAVLATGAAAEDSTNRGKDKKDTAVSSSATDQRSSAAISDDPDYAIGPGDVLNVNVWKEPEVSGTVPVRPDGKVSLPLLGDVSAAGVTPTELAATITDRLRRYMTNPRVTVIVTATNSRRIYLIGEVVRPGAIPMLPKMTVLQALSSAGGFSQFANAKKMYVLRSENGKQIKIPFNYKDAISGHSPEQNIALKPGDTIVVP